MITKLCRLGDKRKQDIRLLEQRCQAYDHSKHSIYLESDCNLDPRMKCFFIHGSKEHPKSVLSITNMEPDRAEIDAFTDPEYRRQGMFAVLWGEAAELLKSRGFRKVFFVHDPAAKDGRAVLKKLGARREKSEFLMQKEQKDLTARTASADIAELSAAASFSDSFEISRAVPEDCDRLAELLNSCFFMDEDDAWDRVSEEFASPVEASAETQGYCSWKAVQDGILAGMCTVWKEGARATLFDICVLREFRQQGIGRAMLLYVLQELKSMGVTCVRLQVSSRSRAAVKLYRSLGFEETERLDYYSYRI